MGVFWVLRIQEHGEPLFLDTQLDMDKILL